MKRSRRWISISLGWCVVFCSVAAQAQSTLADLLAKMPAQSVEEGNHIHAEIIRLGGTAVAEICRRIVPLGAGDDTSARFALSGLAKYVSRAGAAAERDVFERAVLQAVQSPADAEVKAFLMEQLKLTASDTSVGPLSAFLTDVQLCEPATQALLAAGTPAAAAALCKALPLVSGARRVTIIKALGELRDPAAVNEIKKYAGDPDTVVRLEALFALANIGDPASLDILSQATEVSAPFERAQATASLLRYAQRRAEAGDAAGCEAVCRKLMAERSAPVESNVPCAALSMLASIKGPEILRDLLAAMDIPNADLRGAARQLAAGIPGVSATRKWVKKMEKVSPEVRLEILAMLGDRDDKPAVKALIRALGDKDKHVRMIAAESLTRHGGVEALHALVERIERAQDADEIVCLKDAILRVPGETVADEAAEAVPGASGLARAALLEIVGARRAESQAGVVLRETTSEDAAIRLAAISALANVGGGKDLSQAITLLLAAEEEKERAAAHRAVVALARKVTPAKARVAAISSAVSGASGDKKELLLRVFPDLGDDEALEAVVQETKSADTGVAEAALRVLTDWPQAEAGGPLLEVLANTGDAARHQLALGGIVRLASSKQLADEDRVWLCDQSLKAVTTSEEKRQILAALATVRSIDSLRTVSAFLEDPEVKSDGAQAAVAIACAKGKEDTGLDGFEVAQILGKALAAAATAELRQQIQDHINTMPLPEETNLARGKPVRASVPPRGEHVPERAVDGDLDQESAWIGDGTPAWLDVDLGTSAVIDRVHIFFFWDGERYYQYKIEVSPNGMRWKTVADGSANTTPATARGVLLRFPPVKARYVRVNLLKSSAESGAPLVELRVYGENAVLTPPSTPVREEGFVSLFNGKDLHGWLGDTRGYVAQFGKLVCRESSHMNLYTEKEYSDFVLRFDFKLTPGANNGVGIRTPFMGHAAYDGLEIQIQDDTAEEYQEQKPYQVHGSIYGVVPAETRAMKPVGEWNSQEIIANGRRITVNLNGTTILDADLDEASKNGTPDGKNHPGLKLSSGRIAFLGHGSHVEFRNIRIQELN